MSLTKINFKYLVKRTETSKAQRLPPVNKSNYKKIVLVMN